MVYVVYSVFCLNVQLLAVEVEWTQKCQK